MAKILHYFKKLGKHELILIFLISLVLRLVFCVFQGEDRFWDKAFGSYFEIAKNFASGKGFSMGDAPPFYAFFPPGYPFLLGLAMLVSKNYLSVVILNSLLGAATTVCVVFIGKEIFNKKVGLLAGLMTAIYPYYVMHDSALQETSAFTLFTSLTILTLIKAKKSNLFKMSAIAGLALGVVVLVRPVLTPFIPLSLLWLANEDKKFSKRALIKSILTAFFCLLVITPWLVRTHILVGAPLITSQFGKALWGGNNEHTFSYYPVGSMDESRMVAIEAFSEEEEAELKAVENNELAWNNWYAKKGWEFIKKNPYLTLKWFFQKIMVAFSWNFSPQKPFFIQLVYFLSYAPILILGLWGMFLSYKAGLKSEVNLMIFLFLSFSLITGVFWAHTTHRTFLDIYFMIYAAAALVYFKKPAIFIKFNFLCSKFR